MSSESAPPRPNFNKNFHSRGRELPSHQELGRRRASPHVADQKIEAVTRELREILEEAENRPQDRKVAGDAIRLAWSILMFHGFSDFDAIRSVRTEDWPNSIEPSQHALVALALEAIGWYQFGLRPYDIDRTARIFDRCLELAPQHQRALERFAVVANTIQPEHIGGLAKFPKKQRETALGYKLQCKRKIDNILIDIFGITEAHLLGQAEQSVGLLIKSFKDKERRFVFEILGHLSRINTVVGVFFGNGTQLSLGAGAAFCQLEILGLPRDVTNLLDLLRSRSEDCGETEFAGEETPVVCQILEVIAGLFESKWQIFKNHSAQRRAAEIRGFLNSVGMATSFPDQEKPGN